MLALMVAGCTDQTAFRIRSDLTVPLNADAGWAGGLNEDITVLADQPFRLRMEAGPSPDAHGSYALQVRRNAGDWETLEAHDFPHPQRELDISFDDDTPATPPAGWSMPAGHEGVLSVVEGEAGHVLKAAAGEHGLVALFAAPWPLPEFTYTARFNLPESSGTGFDLIFGYVDAGNHIRVRFEPAERIAVLQFAEGRETLLAEEQANISQGAWHEAELQLEDGKLEINLDDDTLIFSVPFEGGARFGAPGFAVSAGAQVSISEFALEGVARTPPVSIVATPAYTNGTLTTDILAGSTAPFRPAFGMSLAEQTPRWDGRAHHGEFEWPLVIRRLADGPDVNQTGDLFEFRMVDAAGLAVPGSAIARVRLAIPEYHLGGTYVETPGRIGPWQAANGDLYFIMEPTETDNKFMMMKSTDGGRSWMEVDGAHRPQTGDLESVDSRQVGDRIHIIHQVTRSVRYHVFRTSDHPTHPDSWERVDEVAAREDAIAQNATAIVRPDGSVVAFFLSDRLHYVMRGAEGDWSAPVEIDPEAGFINTGPQAILGRDSTIHLAYFSDDGGIWYRRLLPDGTLTTRQQVATDAGTGRPEYGAVLPLAYDRATDTVFIVYRLADGGLWESRVQGNGLPTAPVLVTNGPVITDAVDSQQPAADLVTMDAVPYVLFVDEQTRSIFSTYREGADWQEPVLRVDGIMGSWVRGNIIEMADGTHVYGYVYDAGSDGGSGLNRYDVFPLNAE